MLIVYPKYMLKNIHCKIFILLRFKKSGLKYMLRSF